MRRLAVTISLLMVILLALAGCGGRTSEVGAVLDYGFPLAPGQKAVLFGHGLEIEFLDILEDSRCPADAECTWPGRISVMIELRDSQDEYKMVLVQPGLSDDYEEEIYKEYRLRYKVTPYPEKNAEIEREDYRLLLTISKK